MSAQKTKSTITCTATALVWGWQILLVRAQYRGMEIQPLEIVAFKGGTPVAIAGDTAKGIGWQKKEKRRYKYTCYDTEGQQARCLLGRF